MIDRSMDLLHVIPVCVWPDMGWLNIFSYEYNLTVNNKFGVVQGKACEFVG